MTDFDDTPSISVDFMEITTLDTVLMPDQETALTAAQIAGYQMDSYQHAYESRFGHGPKANFSAPDGCASVTLRNGSTEILFHPQSDSLEQHIHQLAVCTAALDHSAHHPKTQQVHICIAMSTDQPPPGWHVAAEMSHTRTIGTDCGIRIKQCTTVRRVHDIEADIGSPAWDLIAHGIIECSTVPTRQELDTLIKATYTEAVLNMVPTLRNPASQHQPLPIPADQLGAFADVVAAELQYTAALCQRYEQHRVPFGSVAAIMAIAPTIENAEAIRPHLDLLALAVPSLAPSAAARIDATVAILNRENQPYDRSTVSPPTQEDAVVITIVANTIAMASKRRAIAHCAAQMENLALPDPTRRTYRSIADLIVHACAHHVDATVGQLELENRLSKDYPDLAAQLVDVLADADPEAMTAFHRACRTIDDKSNSPSS